jgi:hypothetical protein
VSAKPESPSSSSQGDDYTPSYIELYGMMLNLNEELMVKVAKIVHKSSETDQSVVVKMSSEHEKGYFEFDPSTLNDKSRAKIYKLLDHIE